MINLFDWVDSRAWRFNIFRDHNYLQNVALIFCGVACILWLALGFDSGVGILEEAVLAFPSLLNGHLTLNQWIQQSYTVYGRSFHFSAYVIYGLLYVGLSRHLDHIGLEKSRNITYSIALIALNISVFEWWYMGSFTIYQMNRNLLEWIVTDFWFLQQYLWILLFGLVAVIGVWVESHIFNDQKLTGRLFTWKPDRTMLLASVLTVLSIALWIYYPLPVETVMVNDWTSSTMFPQTHYAYKSATLYIENNLLHGVNLIAKAMFALTQLIFVRGFKPVSNHTKTIK